MAYRKHPRHVTNEQFSDNTTVDGDRLDSAMESFERHTNNVPAGDVNTKWVPTSFAAGWIPQRPGTTAIHRWPWLTTPNVSYWVVTGSTVPERFNNYERVKGYSIPGVNPVLAQSPLYEERSSQFIWTTSFHTSRPTIITHLDIMLMTDAVGSPVRDYLNTFQYGASPPTGYGPNDKSRDFSFSLHVDAKTATENRQLNEVEVARNGFLVKDSQMTYKPWPVGFADMTPSAFPGGTLSGVYEPIEGDIPIPQDSRVRLSLVIPPAASGAPDGTYDSPWTDEPWYMQHFMTTLHMLEEVY